MKMCIASIAAAALLQDVSFGWAVRIASTGMAWGSLAGQKRGSSAVEAVHNEADSTSGHSPEVPPGFLQADAAADITEDCLLAHNAKRVDRLPHPLPAMSRDEASVQQAMKYMRQWVARGCPHKLKHSDVPGFGENLYSTTGQPTCQRAVNMWYNEIHLFKGKYPGATWPDEAGHFTQVMWSSSTGVGCAATVGCKFSKVIVCNYRPEGNWSNKEPFSESFWKELLQRDSGGGGDHDPVNKDSVNKDPVNKDPVNEGLFNDDPFDVINDPHFNDPKLKNFKSPSNPINGSTGGGGSPNRAVGFEGMSLAATLAGSIISLCFL